MPRAYFARRLCRVDVSVRVGVSMCVDVRVADLVCVAVRRHYIDAEVEG